MVPRPHYLAWLDVVFILQVCMVETSTISAFTPTTSYMPNKRSRVTTLYSSDESALGKKAYNDDALYKFHMMTQRQKIRDYTALDEYIDSFVRNGLMDLVPPLTETLNVLVVGNTGGAMVRNNEVEEGFADVDEDSPVVNQEIPISAITDVEPTAPNEQSRPDSSCSFLESVFDSTESLDAGGESVGASQLAIASYDCIMDKGLLADLLATDNTNETKENMAKLLFEAAKRLREQGVYVANTAPISLDTKEYLLKLGALLGLQWEFDLDGISDEKTSVNVARKYGTCPESFGLATQNLWDMKKLPPSA